MKNDGVKVSWDDDIPNCMESHKTCSKFQTTNHIFFESTDICLNDIIKIEMDWQ